jgi:hypothetical protein
MAECVLKEFHPVSFLRQPKDLPSGAARDYRLLVDAVLANDLTAAQQAYGRMMERLSSVSARSEDALTRIGAALRSGDLATVRSTLDGLEGKALQVLRGLRERSEMPPPERSGGLRLRKLN